jgi:spermidine synthase
VAGYQGHHYHEALHRAAFALPGWLKNNRRAGQTGASDPAASLWFEQTCGSGISQAMPMPRVYHEQSVFQDIGYYQHERFGRVFVLDGTVQGSHADECIYHEMAVHVPVLGRRRGKIDALIIGGGDGGIVRELLKHDHVTRIVMAEIDERVIETSNRYFAVQGNYSDPRVELIIGDAADYVAKAAGAGERFELIIVDATDSTEPSANLWNDAFFANLAKCLSDDGVCLDSDILIAGKRAMLSRDLHGEGLRDIKRARQFFAGVEGYYSKIPLFPGGWFALFLYTRDGFSYAEPYREFSGIHYNAGLHRAAFVLPLWWQKLL